MNSYQSNGSRRVESYSAFPLVLLCDDDDRDRSRMERLLGRHGFRVHSTNSVAASEQVLKQWQVAAVVADLRLGLGKPDGLELLTVAAREQPGAARVLVTADPAGAEFAKQADGVWIDKSGDTAITLVEVLRSALGS